MIRSIAIRIIVIVALAASFVGMPLTAAFAAPTVAVGAMEDMDCCPDAQQPDPCKNCPAMVICVLKTFQTTTTLGATTVWRSSHAAVFQRISQTAESLAGVPPDQPPRSLT
jgi:hypothetical protein